MSSILVARKPTDRLDAAEGFLSRHPASWHLSRVLALASRASLQAGNFSKALEYGEQSLRLFPENSLVLVPMAAMLDASGRPDAAVETARNALRSLDRFARPSDIPAPAWQALDSDLREVASLVLRRAGADPAEEHGPRLTLSDLSATPLRAAYAGSNACKACHPSEHSNWSETGMARMFRPYDPANVIGDFSLGEFRGESGMSIGLVNNDEGHFFDISGVGSEPQRFRVDYTVGSKWQQAYATRLPDGRIHVFPIQYNRLHGRWLNYWRLIDPPDSRRTEISTFLEFDRATSYQFNCAPCHTSQLAVSPPRSDRTADIRFKEGGVNCEMCHGPSAAHAAAYSNRAPAVKRPEDPPVDFRRIGQEQYTRICAQCHMQSAMFKRGPEGELNHSGDPKVFFQHLRSRPYSEFSKKAFYKDGRFRETTFVVESLLRSRCFEAGGATCGHCHVPHGAQAAGNPKSLKFREEPNRMCLQCHPGKGADLAAHTRHAAGTPASECSSCHMPAIMNSLLFKAGTHRIDDIPDAAMTARFGETESPNACLSCHPGEPAAWLKESLARWVDPEPGDPAGVVGELPPELSAPLEGLLAAINQAVTPAGFSFLVEAGNWAELAKLASSRIAASPGDPNPHYWLGIAHSQGDLVKAVQAFRSAEKLGLATGALHKALGLTYYNLGQYALFTEQMEKAIAADPSDSGPYHYLGRHQERQLNNFPRALDYFEQALEREPNDLQSLYFKGYCLHVMGRHDEAVAAYERAIEHARSRRERFGWPHQKLAELRARDQPASAVEHGRRAVELEPGVAEHRLVLGKIYEQLGRLEESAEQREAASDLRPSDPAIPYVLMRLYRRLGRDEDAEEALKLHERLRQVYGPSE